MLENRKKIQETISAVKSENAPDFKLHNFDETTKKEYIASLNALKLLLEKYNLYVENIDPNPTEGWVVTTHSETKNRFEDHLVKARAIYSTSTDRLLVEVMFHLNGAAGPPSKDKTLQNLQDNPEDLVTQFEDFMSADNSLESEYM